MTAVILNDETLSLAKVAVRENKTIKEVSQILATDIETPQVTDFPAVPEALSITPEFVEALKRLPEVFGAVMPAERRALNDAEVELLFAERETLRAVLDLLNSRDADIKSTVRHHIDVEAEQNGLATPDTTPRDNAGHYLLAAPQQPVRVDIPNTNQAWSSEYREGAVSIDEALLKEMADNGEIDREDYLAFTREVRVFDETKALKALADKPERLQILKAITKRSRATTALFVRKSKKA